jgi:hypothetical protein
MTLGGWNAPASTGTEKGSVISSSPGVWASSGTLPAQTTEHTKNAGTSHEHDLTSRTSQMYPTTLPERPERLRNSSVSYRRACVKDTL